MKLSTVGLLAIEEDSPDVFVLRYAFQQAGSTDPVNFVPGKERI